MKGSSLTKHVCAIRSLVWLDAGLPRHSCEDIAAILQNKESGSPSYRGGRSKVRAVPPLWTEVDAEDTETEVIVELGVSCGAVPLPPASGYRPGSPGAHNYVS